MIRVDPWECQDMWPTSTYLDLHTTYSTLDIEIESTTRNWKHLEDDYHEQISHYSTGVYVTMYWQTKSRRVKYISRMYNKREKEEKYPQ